MRFFILTFLFMSIEANALKVDYNIEIKNPNSHYAQVNIIISDFKEKTLELKMPVWAPGSYMIREFEKNIDRVTATSGTNEINIQKQDKNTWTLQVPNGSKSISVSYPIYCFEQSVRTSFIDNDHAFLILSSCLMFVNSNTQQSGNVQLKFPDNWKSVSTTLINKGNNTYTYDNYDELVDSPIEIGNQEEITFDVAGVKHRAALVGKNNCDKEQFKKDLQKVCSTMYDIIGAHPCKEYLFIIHHVEEGGGGLEHANSSVVQMPRFNYTNKDRYKAFLGLCAHEYFHLWNVKRIRPAALGPFDYSKENHTNLLWVAEGITSYYDELAMYRAGFTSQPDYLKSLASTFGATLNRKGGEKQSMHEASFDAWIKEYRSTENSINNNISYYLKGSALAALLDIELLSATGGEKGLDHLMRHLYNEFYKKGNRGFSDEEFYSAIDKVAGKTLDFKKWATEINNSSTLEKMQNVFKKAACTLANKETKNIHYSGINIEMKGERMFVRSVDADSPAWLMGIQAGDELIAVNEMRLKNNLDEVLKLTDGEVNLLITRAGLIRTVKVQLTKSPKLDLQLTIDKGDDSILLAWLKLTKQ